MHFGIEVVPFGYYSDPRSILELAVAAETAGWEGLWIWDHMNFPYGVADPWITLAAVAASTKKIKLITGVAPAPRYRPHLLARTLSALDILSAGRVIFGSGLGIEPDFSPFGEPGDAHTRAGMLDESLALLNELWQGDEVKHRGTYYTVDGFRLAPLPLQKPRIPVWIGGDSPRALRRAAQWDGWIMGTIDENRQITTPPERIATLVTQIRQQRAGEEPFNVAVDGTSEIGEREMPQAYEQAGATWWFECLYPLRGPHQAMLDRVKAGPPR